MKPIYDDPEHIKHREYMREWQKRQADKVWNKINREKHNEIRRRSYRKHREKELAASKPRWSAWAAKKPIKRMLSQAKTRAKKKGFEFNLTEADFNHIPQICPVLGIPLHYGGPLTNSTASLERIDNNKGYVPDNVMIISWRANNLKSDSTLNELTQIVKFFSQGSSANTLLGCVNNLAEQQEAPA